ncbi:hypothetical protein Tco_0678492 [Tanacetum coccineum]|uniref:Xylulose kinase-1 n=1 Tax=Tanacetum coccineum TaxID=301880 RepID=A0ABQ4XF93_9ASTR
MVAYLEKSEGSEGFHQIIDFMNTSHIKYALTENPTIYASFIKQFWRTVTASTNDHGQMELTASIDGQDKTITEASLRRNLKLEDNEGVNSLPNFEIFEQLALMGYVTDSDKLTFQKGVEVPLFSTILNAPTTSPSRVTSSASLSSEPSPQHITTSAPSTSQPANSQPTQGVEEPAPLPHESPLLSVHSLRHNEVKATKQTYNAALTKLIKRVKKLEQIVKTSKSQRRAKIVLSEDEDVVEDSSKQGRKISEIDEDPNISLAQDEEITWFQDMQEDAQDSDEKGQPEVTTAKTALDNAGVSVSTAVVQISTASTTPGVRTAGRIMYSRRSAKRRKDKGKVIMTEPEPEKKSKKQLKLERLGHEEAVRLQEHITSQEQEKQRVVTESDLTQVIDWSDPAVIRYHALLNRPRSVAEVRKNMCKYLCNQGGYKMKHFKGMTYDDIRPIFEKVWDQIHEFKPMDTEVVIPKSKGAESAIKSSTEEEKKRDDRSKPAEGRRKKSLARKRASGKDSEESMKKQKLEETTKYPIVDWKTYVLTENFMYYQIFRADGSSKYYKIFSEMLEDFDRHDVLDLYRLVKERYMTSRPEGYDLMLWGDLKTLFEPDEENEVWKNQHGYNLIS